MDTQDLVETIQKQKQASYANWPVWYSNDRDSYHVYDYLLRQDKDLNPDAIYLSRWTNTERLQLLDLDPTYNYMDLERFLEFHYSWKPTMNKLRGGDNHPLAKYLQDIQSKFHVDGWTEKLGQPSDEILMREYLLIGNGNQKLELIDNGRVR
jgi:hypothetical protein